jgi:hypothetical protein
MEGRTLAVPGLLEHHARACLHEGVVAGPPSKRSRTSVPGDRAVDEARMAIDCVSQAEPSECRGRERIEQHVAGPEMGLERLPPLVGAEIQRRAALAAAPHQRTRGLERIATRRYDPQDVGTGVCEQHRGDRTGRAA